MEREIVNDPFEFLHVAVLGGTDKRVYVKEGQARARITGAVDQKREIFVQNVQLWRVGSAGWELVFSANAGDHHSKISWKTVIEANKRRDKQYELDRKKWEEDKARAQYDELRKRFG